MEVNDPLFVAVHQENHTPVCFRSPISALLLTCTLYHSTGSGRPMACQRRSFSIDFCPGTVLIVPSSSV